MKLFGESIPFKSDKFILIQQHLRIHSKTAPPSLPSVCRPAVRKVTDFAKSVGFGNAQSRRNAIHKNKMPVQSVLRIKRSGVRVPPGTPKKKSPIRGFFCLGWHKQEGLEVYAPPAGRYRVSPDRRAKKNTCLASSGRYFLCFKGLFRDTFSDDFLTSIFSLIVLYRQIRNFCQSNPQ